MKTISIFLCALAALSSAQKHRAGPHGGKHGGHQSYDEPQGKSQYTHGGNYQSYGGGAHGGAATAAKPTYPQLISDSRTLNHDGTINFNYAADNGLQQGETVDPDGTRRGFYSYIGADGKALTVKYTAGKNGFIAEGDHLPKQPNVAAAQTKDEVSTKPAHGGHDNGAYHGGPSAGNYYGGAPAHYSAGIGPAGPSHRGHGGHGGPPAYSQYNQHNEGVSGRSQYNPPSPYHDGPQAARASFGGFGGPSHGGSSQHTGHYQSSPQTQYSQSLPSHGHHSGRSGFSGPANFAGNNGGVMHSAFNPYSPAGPAGPYQGNFDLGNGGHYSINFEPGQVQEVGVGASYNVAGPGGASSQQQY